MNAIASRRCNRIAAALFLLALTTIAASSYAQPAPAPAAANVSPPIPATSAVLIVDSPEGVPDSEVQLQRRVNIHIATLRSEKNIRTMISSINSETRKTSWFTSANDPHERTIWLRDHLHVKQVEGTPLIEVSLLDVADPSDRQKILRDVCDTYLATTSKQQADVLGDRSYGLNMIKSKIEGRLAQLSADMRQKQITLNLDGAGIGRLGVKDIELSKLVDQAVNAQIQYDKANEAYKVMGAAIQKGQNPKGLDAILAGNARIAELQRHLDDAELGLEIARSKSVEKQAPQADPLDKAPNAKPAVAKDPAIAQLQAETAYLRKKLDLLSSEATARAKVQLFEEAEMRANESKNTMLALKERVAVLKDEIGDLNNSLILYTTAQEEQKGLREQLRSVRQQIEQIMAIQGRNSSIGIHWHIEPEAEAAN